VLQTTTVGSDGTYKFEGLDPGVYQVREVNLANQINPITSQYAVTVASGKEYFATQAQLSAYTDGRTENGELLPGQEGVLSGDALSLVNTIDGSIHAFKFNDKNANGIYEPGLASPGNDVPMTNISFTLTYDSDANGSFETTIGSQLTDVNGYVAFSGLNPGAYKLTENFTGGGDWAATVNHDLPPLTAGDATSATENYSIITVASGKEYFATQAQLAATTLLPGQEAVLVGTGLTFGNHAIGACGLTPGFWQAWSKIWDGVAGNESRLQKNLINPGKIVPLPAPNDDLLLAFPQNFPKVAKHSAAATYVADLNQPGDLALADTADLINFGGDGRKDQLYIEWSDAQAIINPSKTSNPGDKLLDFTRFAAANLLNDVGVPDYVYPADLKADAYRWLAANAPKQELGDVNGDGIDDWVLMYNNQVGGFGSDGKFTVKASSSAWQSPAGSLPSGSDIYGAMANQFEGSCNLATSLDESRVMWGRHLNDYFSVSSVLPNTPGAYASLV